MQSYMFLKYTGQGEDIELTHSSKMRIKRMTDPILTRFGLTRQSVIRMVSKIERKGRA